MIFSSLIDGLRSLMRGKSVKSDKLNSWVPLNCCFALQRHKNKSITRTSWEMQCKVSTCVWKPRFYSFIFISLQFFGSVGSGCIHNECTTYHICDLIRLYNSILWNKMTLPQQIGSQQTLFDEWNLVTTACIISLDSFVSRSALSFTGRPLN